MSATRTLLIEIGCEELPSSSLRTLGVALDDLVGKKLAERKLAHGASRWFATPRRLAVVVEGLQEQAPTQVREALGPPVDQARDGEGNWSRAAEGFAKRQGVTPDELDSVDTPKGPRLGLVREVPGVRAVDVLADLLRDVIDTLPVAKRMRWGASRLEFARPIQWLVLMFGEEYGFGEVHGIATGNRTFGHRFHSPDALYLPRAEAYEQTMQDARVVADFDRRGEMIREQVHHAAAQIGARALTDEALLAEVTSLVEWPVALTGSFDEKFLRVPAEALISSMREHQKYFPLVDDSGALLPRFITISNIESRDPQQVIAGNERVIRPRLADAAFFFEKDLKRSLAARVEDLAKVVFQEKLGSVGDKATRISQLARELATATGAEPGNAERAGRLCKADLVSEMVLEFTDLQGIAGSYYARNDGENESVATAVEQHYWPLHAGAALPGSPVATSVALADRLDTLVGIFGIGQPPSGSRDPFALRRASIAVLRILIENALDLDLREGLALAAGGFPEGVLDEGTVDSVIDYMLDRLPALYEDSGVPIEVFRAVRATGCTVPKDFDRRLRAVQTFRDRPEAEALAAANKRVGNILAKADSPVTSVVSTDLLVESAEIDLNALISRVGEDNARDLARADYDAALSRLAGLRDHVDRFFDEVMVNADDQALRNNRLALLAGLRAQFVAIADISQLAA